MSSNPTLNQALQAFLSKIEGQKPKALNKTTLSDGHILSFEIDRSFAIDDRDRSPLFIVLKKIKGRQKISGYPREYFQITLSISIKSNELSIENKKVLEIETKDIDDDLLNISTYRTLNAAYKVYDEMYFSSVQPINVLQSLTETIR